MNLRTALNLAVFIGPVAVAACGGGQAEPTTPSAPAATATAAPAEPAPTSGPGSAAPGAAPAAGTAPAASAAPSGPPGPGDWDKWSHEQKLAYMKSDVMPKFGQLFHDFDAKHYAEPQCVLCHGSAAKDGSFKMPNPELPKLDLTPAGFKKMQAKKPKVLEFMVKQVEPQMASLIGEQPFDPKTHQGFGCTGCHTTIEQPGTGPAAGSGPAPKK